MRIYFLPLLLVFFSCQEQTTIDEIEQTADLVKSETENLTNEVEPEVEVELDSVLETQADSESTSEQFDDVDWNEYEESMTKDYSFVIILSSKSYSEALDRAKEASNKLGYPLDLRDLHENKEMGLSLPREVCEEDICGGGLSYPIYLPRNDWGDSKYVSVEYSDGFEGFTKGYYIVVIASGEKGDPMIKEALNEAKKFYSDAYAKTCGVWMGCQC